jgi:hypothetical protein
MVCRAGFSGPARIRRNANRSAEPYDGEPAFDNHTTDHALGHLPVFRHLLDGQKSLAYRGVIAGLTVVVALPLHSEPFRSFTRLQCPRRSLTRWTSFAVGVFEVRGVGHGATADAGLPQNAILAFMHNIKSCLLDVLYH